MAADILSVLEVAVDYQHVFCGFCLSVFLRVYIPDLFFSLAFLTLLKPSCIVALVPNKLVWYRVVSIEGGRDGIKVASKPVWFEYSEWMGNTLQLIDCEYPIAG